MLVRELTPENCTNFTVQGMRITAIYKLTGKTRIWLGNGDYVEAVNHSKLENIEIPDRKQRQTVIPDAVKYNHW